MIVIIDLFKVHSSSKKMLAIYSENNIDYEFLLTDIQFNLSKCTDRAGLAKLVMCVGVNNSLVIDRFGCISVSVENLSGATWFLAVDGAKPVSRGQRSPAIDFEGGSMVCITDTLALLLINDINLRHRLYEYIYVSVNGTTKSLMSLVG